MNTNFTKEELEKLRTLIAPKNKEEFEKLMGINKPMFKKEDFITGDKVILRNGDIYLIIRDCKAGIYGKQKLVLLHCSINGGFTSSFFYDDELKNTNKSEFDIMKIYRFEDGKIVKTSISDDLDLFDLIWSRD